MTADEAIKLLDELQGLLPEVGFNKYIASVRLGSEALRAIKYARNHAPAIIFVRLPGEERDNERQN